MSTPSFSSFPKAAFISRLIGEEAKSPIPWPIWSPPRPDPAGLGRGRRLLLHHHPGSEESGATPHRLKLNNPAQAQTLLGAVLLGLGWFEGLYEPAPTLAPAGTTFLRLFLAYGPVPRHSSVFFGGDAVIFQICKNRLSFSSPTPDPHAPAHTPTNTAGETNQ